MAPGVVNKPQTPIKYLLLVDQTIYAVDMVGGMNPVCGVIDESTAGLLLLLLGDFHGVPMKQLDALNEAVVEVTAKS